jgi:hypothetical protein
MSRENWSGIVLAAAVTAFVFSGCGQNSDAKRGSGGDETILDFPRDVMDATAFGIASKAELSGSLTSSMALADLAAGRLFDFDDSMLASSGDGVLSAAEEAKPVFCEGEIPSLDVAKVDEGKLMLRYEADVTTCARKPSDDGISLAVSELIVDAQRAAFSMTFTCASRDLSSLRDIKSARTILSNPAAFACAASVNAQTTGRAYQFAIKTLGRIPGPRSDVPVEQWFLRGYDSGQQGAPCTLSRTEEGPLLGACRLYERADLTNLVDNSRRGRLLSAVASQRKRGGNFFADGSLEVRFNGWAGATTFSLQDPEIKIDLAKSGGECATFSLRPRMANFEGRDCSL